MPWEELDSEKNRKRLEEMKKLIYPDFVFHYYKKLIALRKEHEIFAEGSFRLLLKEDENIFAYEREYNGKKLLWQKTLQKRFFVRMKHL